MLRVLRAFEREGLDYVLIGAAAMGFHGVVRATEGLDLFIRATAENVERLKRAFRAAYANDPNIDEIRAGTSWETTRRFVTTPQAATCTST